VESIVDTRWLHTINTGSSSLKADLYRLPEDTTETPERAPTLIPECETAIAGAIAYSREHFEDSPEISNWTWTP
jgi:hypothetical protein